MTSLLKQSFLAVANVDESAPDLPLASEILLARISAMAYSLVHRAPQSAVVAAAAAGSNSALMEALASMASTESPSQDAWTSALLRGRFTLAECLEASGGVWTAEEAVVHLGVTRQTLQQWQSQGRVLALARHDGSFSYPVAQFEPAAADTEPPRPYGAIRQINEIVGASLSREADADNTNRAEFF